MPSFLWQQGSFSFWSLSVWKPRAVTVRSATPKASAAAISAHPCPSQHQSDCQASPPHPPPTPALAQQRADHQAITRELGNREEIQSLKGLNTGRGSRWWRAEAPAAPRAEWDHWVWGGLVRGEVGVSYTKDLAGTDWVCVIVYMNTHLFTNTQSLHLRPDVLIHRAGFHSRILCHCFRVKALYF